MLTRPACGNLCNPCCSQAMSCWAGCRLPMLAAQPVSHTVATSCRKDVMVCVSFAGCRPAFNNDGELCRLCGLCIHLRNVDSAISNRHDLHRVWGFHESSGESPGEAEQWLPLTHLPGREQAEGGAQPRVALLVVGRARVHSGHQPPTTLGSKITAFSRVAYRSGHMVLVVFGRKQDTMHVCTFDTGEDV